MPLKFHVRDVARLKEILTVFSEEGFHFLLVSGSITHYLPLVHRIKKKEEVSDLPVRLRKALERLGPTFVKLGQMLSMRPDFIPAEYALELRKLQDDVTPISYGEVKKVVESELKKKIPEVFNSFSKQPIAAASLAQVHSAFLKNGKRVAIKVQRPNARAQLETDIEIMYALARIAEKHELFSAYRPLALVEEFEEWTKKELQFEVEARHYAAFAAMFANDPLVIFPAPNWELTTDKVLVMDFIDGEPIGEKKSKALALKIFEVFFVMVFEHGFYHADMHPGNILLVKNKLAILDVGMSGTLSKKLRVNLQKWMMHVLEGRYDYAADDLLEVCSTNQHSNVSGFKKEVIKIITDSYHPVLEQSDARNSFFHLVEAAIKNNIHPSEELILFIRSGSYVERIAVELWPTLNMRLDVLPFLKNQSLKQTRKVAKQTMIEYGGIAQELPDMIKLINRKISDGLTLNVEHKELVTFESVLDRVGVNIAFGLVISALLIGGSITLSYSTQIFGMSIISFVLFSVAFILLIWMLYRICGAKEIWEKLLR